MNDKPLSVEAVAERWGTSRTFVYSLVQSGELSAFRLGKLWRIPFSAVEDYELQALHIAPATVPTPNNSQPQDVRRVMRHARMRGPLK